MLRDHDFADCSTDMAYPLLSESLERGEDAPLFNATTLSRKACTAELPYSFAATKRKA